MSKSTARQNYLYLVARLYELAAEFSDADLREVRETFVNKNELGVAKAIDALISLHGVAAAARPSVVQTLARTKKSASVPRASQESWSGKALEDLFDDQALFPRVHDIARLVPGSLVPLPKESRSRYIRRAAKYLASLDEKQKTRFRDNLASELEKKPNNFLSRWKNLIREL